jgi:hypothetical protein
MGAAWQETISNQYEAIHIYTKSLSFVKEKANIKATGKKLTGYRNLDNQMLPNFKTIQQKLVFILAKIFF